MVTCKNCSKEFSLPGINSMYCSGICLNDHLKNTVWKKNKDFILNKKRCIRCKKKFVLPGISNLYCTVKCEERSKPKKRPGKYVAPSTKKKKKIKFKSKGVIHLKKIRVGFYESPLWQALRYKIIKKYERKCMVCFRTGIELHVDHIKPISKFPELALEPENLQVLCRDCNLGKSNTDCIDWRPV